MISHLNISIILSFVFAVCSCSSEGNKEKTERKVTYNIQEILAIKDPSQAIMELDSHLNEMSNYGSDISTLTSSEKVVLFIENLEREVNNGGFNQFFFNSSGDFAHETVSALRTIGANKAAGIVERAYSEWPNGEIPQDQSERQEVRSSIENQANGVWSKCDKEFWQYPDDLSSLLLTFVRNNLADFK